MSWKKLKKGIEMWGGPSIGSFTGRNPVMALAIDDTGSKNGKYIGLARFITKRTGSPDSPGFVDKSKLHIVTSSDALFWKKSSELKIAGISKIIKKISSHKLEFIGLEDPDIWTDKHGIKQVYFTIAFKILGTKEFEVFLGHAKGKSLKSLKATSPVLAPHITKKKMPPGFKEASISPIAIRGSRIVLVESGFGAKGTIIIAAKAHNLGERWKTLRVVADPNHLKQSWLSGELSTGPIFPPEFLSHKKLLVGIINGRAKSHGNRYGKFRPGLFLFNPRTGKIPWIAKKPLIEDPKAHTITFASDFLQINKTEGYLYAQVNDSFVRAYKLYANYLRKLLPKN